MRRQSPHEEMAQMLEQAMQQAFHDMVEDADRLDIDEMQLPLDEGLEVVIQSHDAGRYDDSHYHTMPEDDAVILHLEPPVAQAFDERVTNFCEVKDLDCGGHE